ncbi:cell wall-active antibiotics response protein LiaF [Cytobacillus spongiae]|uniref:cell wall-active antibiotics response protein LiaF n=1 Tax=Cytobacillus spongiae TaxID=2901381 RepID=UPI001F2C2EAD|nr:cell wall-active antibiotics response protein LiaF [Cytobacillus spongiae]UII56480.1 cell wall-active antibiotics response protein LiaF [Cytobacillus spongiae]
MFNRIKKDYISWIMVVGVIILLFEIVFISPGLIFSILVAVGFTYIGRQRLPRTSGKIFFWGGVVFLIIIVFDMLAFKFLLLALLGYLVIQFATSKGQPERIRPIVKEPNQAELVDTFIKSKPLFENFLFGEKKTPDYVYEWNDINIQAGIGDTVIDLGYTVLPKGETVIFIRNFVGKVQVYVPYDLEVCVNHSVIAGTTTVFDYHQSNMINQNLHIQTAGFDRATQKIKIFTSFFVGDLEVKRV